MTPRPQCLIVGAGITSSLIASFLRKSGLPRSCIEIWEKASDVGGRFAGIPNNPVDMGAQYLTMKLPQHKHVYQELVEHQILTEFMGTIENAHSSHSDFRHYVAPAGLASVVKYYLSDTQVSLNRCLIRLEKLPDSNKWQVQDQHDVVSEYDIVILTVPVPQIFELQTSFRPLLKSFEDMKTHVSYSKRFALCLEYHADDLAFPTWIAKYINDSPVIRFVSIDSKKKSQCHHHHHHRSTAHRGERQKIQVVVHAGVPYSIKNWHLEDSAIVQRMIQEMLTIVPTAPSANATLVRWAPSQFSSSSPSHNDCCLAMMDSPTSLVLAGDSFTGASNFDQCLISATAAAASVIANNVW